MLPHFSQGAELVTKLLTLNQNVKLKARVSNPTDKTNLARNGSEIAAKKPRERTITRKLEPVNGYPTANTPL